MVYSAKLVERYRALKAETPDCLCYPKEISQ
jgi:hypothetical protein